MKSQNKFVLGIDTSNYKTSVAVYYPETGVWHSCGKLLDVPAGSLGLRQSDALFQHTRRLPEITAEACEKAEGVLSAVGYSSRPRAVEGSYMPCFLAGAGVAESLAAAAKVPVHACSHQQGHLAAAAFSVGRMDLLDAPFLAWHLSGGTTELLLVKPDETGALQTEIIGGTTDISAGQLIDRAGVALGMQFPAGPYVESAAGKSDSRDGFTPKMQGCHFSLSGVENQFQQRIRQGMPAEDVCAFVLNTVCRTVVRASQQARKQYGLPILVSGGVSACGILRQRMEESLSDVWVARHGLGGDNALGCALLAAGKR